MREIKFRAWDEDAKQMITWEEIDEADKRGVVQFLDMLQESQFKLMQYTGLKDRNGVEIYEGDILADVISRGKKVLLNEIVYEKGAFRHKFLDESTRHLRGREIEPMFDNTSLIFEVVGNIYETKEDTE